MAPATQKWKRISHETASVLDATYFTNLAVKRILGIKVSGREVSWGKRDAYRMGIKKLMIRGTVVGRPPPRSMGSGSTWYIEADHALSGPDALQDVFATVHIVAQCDHERREAFYPAQELDGES